LLADLRDGTLEEFTEMMLRLRLLVHGRERLRSYVLPIDEDGNGHLDPLELDRLLRSVGLQPLEESERRWFSPIPPRGWHGRSSWTVSCSPEASPGVSG
jgi:hypothetical protein